jgi:hypothetical protein
MNRAQRLNEKEDDDKKKKKKLTPQRRKCRKFTLFCSVYFGHLNVLLVFVNCLAKPSLCLHAIGTNKKSSEDTPKFQYQFL